MIDTLLCGCSGSDQAPLTDSTAPAGVSCKTNVTADSKRSSRLSGICVRFTISAALLYCTDIEIEQACSLISEAAAAVLNSIERIYSDNEAFDLRDAYLDAGILDPKWLDDMTHVALSYGIACRCNSFMELKTYRQAGEDESVQPGTLYHFKFR